MEVKIVGYLVLLIAGALCSDVLELTDSNFQSEIDDKDIILVEFFAPWCGHCKRLAPEYEIAATKLKKNDPPVPLAKVDCVGEGKETCSKNGVSGYPTLKIFRGGQLSQDYDGPRDSDGIVSYMKKNSGPSSVEIKNNEHLDQKLNDAEDVLVIGYFKEENDLYKQFMKAADQQRVSFAFAHCLNGDVNTKQGHENVIVLHRPKHMHSKHEEPKEVLRKENANTYQIIDFVKEKQNGLVGQLTASNKETFPPPLVTVYYKVDWLKNPKGSKYWRNRVLRVAKKLAGKVTFAIAAKSDFSRQISDWGFDENNEDVHAVGSNSKKQVFKMEEKFSVDNLEKFAMEFKEGTLKPYIKSEPVPESNDGPVKVVVGENFDEIVNDPSKDVLIEFYAPWCGHCKSLEPKYNELGEKLKDIKDVVIAKMDATANDVPHPYEVSGFPTIYWSPMRSKNAPKKYEGGREVSNFVDFIKNQATNPVEIETKKKKKKKSKKEL